MRAIIHDRYGPPKEVLELREVNHPTIRADEVLVEVQASAVAGDDWHLTWGLPYVARTATGLRKPRHKIAGREVAGRITSVGSAVTRFTPGDDVFGWCTGAFAEYASVPANSLTFRPEALSPEEAAVVPISGMTALQALRNKGQVQRGHRVLIVGASGGVGTFAVQIAKSLAAHVTGVCSTDNVDLVDSLGADAVVDYTTDDYTQPHTPYDVIVDMVGDRPIRELRSALTPTGTLVIVGGTGGLWFKGTQRFVLATLTSPFTRRRLRPLIHQDRADDLAMLKALIDTGRLRPMLTATYPLEKVPQAITHYWGGHARGKIAITI